MVAEFISVGVSHNRGRMFVNASWMFLIIYIYCFRVVLKCQRNAAKIFIYLVRLLFVKFSSIPVASWFH